MHHRATHVAGVAIRLAIVEGIVTRKDLKRALDEPPSDSTLTRVLQQLEADGWLRRTEKHSRLWRAGSQARTLCDLSEAAAAEADREPATPGDSVEPGSRDPFENLL